MNVWEVEESRPVEEEPPKRKRVKTRDHDPISEREPAGDGKPWKATSQCSGDQLVAISRNVDFHFYFYVGESGTILTIGSLYSFDFCRDSIFICRQVFQKIRNFLSLHSCYVLWWRVKLKVLMGVFAVP